MKVKRRKITTKYKSFPAEFSIPSLVSHGNNDAPITVGIQGQNGSSEVAQQQDPSSLESERPASGSFLLYYLCVLGQIA